MSRASSLVFGTVAFALAASVMGCEAQLTVKTKTRFQEENISKDADWAGGPIEIKIEGTGVSVNGGVVVRADPAATKVTAKMRFIALAFAEEKSNADQSIIEAKETFSITNSGNGLVVACGHGGTHGSSNSGESGCELAEITIPAGDATNKLDLKVLSGNGGINLQLSGAALANLGTNSASGDTTAVLPATQGATISLVSAKADDFDVRMPGDFSADEVILQADEIDNAFTDAKLGAGAGGRGTAGTGLKSLKITSQEFAGGTGKIVLRQ